jgi:hypothetical protein
MRDDGSIDAAWAANLLNEIRAGNECVILTCNTQPDMVRSLAKVFPHVNVHRFKRSDIAGKARWLHANAHGRRTVLIDDQQRYLDACARYGVIPVKA